MTARPLPAAHGRRRRPAFAWGLLLALTAGVWLSSGAAQARSLVLDFDGCDTAVDQAEVVSLLRLELGPEGSASTVALLSPDAPADALRLRILCTGAGPDVTITLDGRPLTALSFSDVPIHMRPRTLALALAERVRRVRLEAVAPPPPAVPAFVAAPPAPELARRPSRPVPSERMRRAGTWAWALAIPTAVGFSIGAPVAAIGDAQRSEGSLRAAGAGILGVSCAPLIGSVIALGIWLQEKGKLDRETHDFEDSARRDGTGAAKAPGQ